MNIFSRWRRFPWYSAHGVVVVFFVTYIVAIGWSTVAPTVVAAISFLIPFAVIGLLCAVSLWWSRPQLRLLIAAGLAATLAIWRVETATPAVAVERIASAVGKRINIEGVVVHDPDRRLDRTYYLVQIERPEKLQSVALRVRAPRESGPRYGDLVRFACTPRIPEAAVDEAFRYDRYAWINGFVGECTASAIGVVGKGESSVFWRILFAVRSRVARAIDAVWKEPESSFIAGILYGSRSGLPPALTDLFAATGVTHLIAVSGANLNIIIVAVAQAFIWGGLSERKTWFITVAAIIVFVLFAGASASVVRAGIMVVITLMARQMSRRLNPALLIMYAVAVLITFSPYSLLFDIGFHLSVAATLGLLYVQPLLERWVPRKRFTGVVAALAEAGLTTLSATISTLPFIMYYFGRVSLVALVANTLVVPLTSFIMFFAFIATLVGLVHEGLGSVVGVVAGGLVRIIFYLLRLLARVPFAVVSVAMGRFGMFAAYAALIFGIGYTRLRIDMHKRTVR